jgi:hypothetical protein
VDQVDITGVQDLRMLCLAKWVVQIRILTSECVEVGKIFSALKKFDKLEKEIKTCSNHLRGYRISAEWARLTL